MPEGLLDDDAAPGPLGVGQAGRAEVGHDVLVRRWRRGQVEEPITTAAGGSLALDRLKQAVARSKRENLKGALMYLDLDGFKEINDQYGHETGDRLLVAVAARLRDCVRETDTIARIGGDEFLVILQALERLEHSTYLAGKIHDLFLEPIAIDHLRFDVTVSIGITYFPDDGKDPRELLRNADTAMYRAKQAGQNQSRFFAES